MGWKQTGEDIIDVFVFPGEDESGRKLVDFRIRIITEFNGIDKRESKGLECEV